MTIPMIVRHTWHPNTFGLLYGKTTKTACGRRVATDRLVKTLETDCPGCQEIVIAQMVETHNMYQSALKLANEAGYSTIKDFTDSLSCKLHESRSSVSFK